MFIIDAGVSVHTVIMLTTLCKLCNFFVTVLLYHLSKCPPHPDIPDSPENNQLAEELDKMNEQRARLYER